MTEPVPMAPEIEALVLATLEKRVADRIKLVKATVGQRYPEGHRETFRSPLDGAKLGMVYRSDPDPQWRVVDERELNLWLVQQAAWTEQTVEIVGDDAEVLAVLQEHAPHLLDDVVRVRHDAVATLLAESKRTGVAAAPGIACVKPSGSLTVRPDKAAGEVVERLHAAGLITWDGRPALPSGAEGAA